MYSVAFELTTKFTELISKVFSEVINEAGRETVF